MNSVLHATTTLLLAFSTTVTVARAQHSTMAPGMTHEQHLEQMKKDVAMQASGKRAMGFDQKTTTHRFRLLVDGGSVAVDVNRPGDQAGRDQIRRHLREIAGAFQQGDFGKPLLTHGEEPPGVPVLRRLKAAITCDYADSELGGLLRIVTANREALEAVHAFLVYQIAEHGTGDPLTVPKGH